MPGNKITSISHAYRRGVRLLPGVCCVENSCTANHVDVDVLEMPAQCRPQAVHCVARVVEYPQALVQAHGAAGAHARLRAGAEDRGPEERAPRRQHPRDLSERGAFSHPVARNAVE